MSGIFYLTTAADLRGKLRRDLEKLKHEPLNGDAAINFLLTAEHMLDWVYPKRVNRKKRHDEKSNSMILRICSHVANGAKHFEVEDPQHDSVSSTGTAAGYFAAPYHAPRYFSNAYFGAGRMLAVRLKGSAAKQLGPRISVVDLAEKVMEYWDKHPLV
jgi:hypothetical protein